MHYQSNRAVKPRYQEETHIAAERVFGASSGLDGFGCYIFKKRNLLDMPAVLAGLLTVLITA